MQCGGWRSRPVSPTMCMKNKGLSKIDERFLAPLDACKLLDNKELLFHPRKAPRVKMQDSPTMCMKTNHLKVTF